jgi:hypothetical protein
MASILYQTIGAAQRRGEEQRLDKIHNCLNMLNQNTTSKYEVVEPILIELNNLRFDLGGEMWKFQGQPLFSNISRFLQRQE